MNAASEEARLQVILAVGLGIVGLLSFLRVVVRSSSVPFNGKGKLELVVHPLVSMVQQQQQQPLDRQAGTKDVSFVSGGLVLGRA